MTIIPLTYSVCNWNDFASFCNAVKANATQGIQATTDYGKITQTLAKLKGNKPDFSIFHLTVGVDCDRKLINEIYDLQLFRMTTFTVEERILSIINASIQTWRQGCVENCVKGKSKAIKEFFNSIFLMLEHAAPESVIDLHKIMEVDGTFSFKQRY